MIAHPTATIARFDSAAGRQAIRKLAGWIRTRFPNHGIDEVVMKIDRLMAHKNERVSSTGEVPAGFRERKIEHTRGSQAHHAVLDDSFALTEPRNRTLRRIDTVSKALCVERPHEQEILPVVPYICEKPPSRR